MDLLKLKERRDRKAVRKFLASISSSQRERIMVLFAEMMERERENGRASICVAPLPRSTVEVGYLFPH